MTPSPAGKLRRSGWIDLLGTALGPLLGLVAVIVLFAVADALKAGDDTFLGMRNARTIAVQASTVFVAALGMTALIIAGGIDLSAGTALALCATVLAWCLREGFGVGPAVAASIATGALAGCINGTLVATLGVVPFIVTLGTMTMYLGLAKLLAEETTVRPSLAQVPEWLPSLVSLRPEPEWLVFPVGVWLALALAVLLALILHRTVFGRWVFALGSNEATARLCGIPVAAVKIGVYTLSGMFVGVAGMYQFARLSSGNPTSGIGLELRIIAAVVIGGGSLSGGRGSVLGTLAGALMMAVIASGCTLLALSNSLQDVIIGAIIIAAVSLDQWRQRRLASF